jgi:hypothetical protein
MMKNSIHGKLFVGEATRRELPNKCFQITTMRLSNQTMAWLWFCVKGVQGSCARRVTEICIYSLR